MTSASRQLPEIADARAQASERLAQIAGECGRDSPLYRCCRELWQRRLEDASVSLQHQDVDNALVILKRGLHALTFGPDVTRRDGLSLEDAMKLISGV